MKFFFQVVSQLPKKFNMLRAQLVIWFFFGVISCCASFFKYEVFMFSQFNILRLIFVVIWNMCGKSLTHVTHITSKGVLFYLHKLWAQFPLVESP